jgi:hypothetical protein
MILICTRGTQKIRQESPLLPFIIVSLQFEYDFPIQYHNPFGLDQFLLISYMHVSSNFTDYIRIIVK